MSEPTRVDVWQHGWLDSMRRSDLSQCCYCGEWYMTFHAMRVHALTCNGTPPARYESFDYEPGDSVPEEKR